MQQLFHQMNDGYAIIPVVAPKSDDEGGLIPAKPASDFLACFWYKDGRWHWSIMTTNPAGVPFNVEEGHAALDYLAEQQADKALRELTVNEIILPHVDKPKALMVIPPNSRALIVSAQTPVHHQPVPRRDATRIRPRLGLTDTLPAVIALPAPTISTNPTVVHPNTTTEEIHAACAYLFDHQAQAWKRQHNSLPAQIVTRVPLLVERGLAFRQGMYLELTPAGRQEITTLQRTRRTAYETAQVTYRLWLRPRKIDLSLTQPQEVALCVLREFHEKNLAANDRNLPPAVIEVIPALVDAGYIRHNKMAYTHQYQITAAGGNYLADLAFYNGSRSARVHVAANKLLSVPAIKVTDNELATLWWLHMHAPNFERRRRDSVPAEVAQNYPRLIDVGMAEFETRMGVICIKASERGSKFLNILWQTDKPLHNKITNLADEWIFSIPPSLTGPQIRLLVAIRDGRVRLNGRVHVDGENNPRWATVKALVRYIKDGLTRPKIGETRVLELNELGIELLNQLQVTS